MESDVESRVISGKFSRSKLTAKRAGNFAVDKIRSKRNFKSFYIPHDDDLHVTEAECKEIYRITCSVCQTSTPPLIKV